MTSSLSLRRALRQPPVAQGGRGQSGDRLPDPRYRGPSVREFLYRLEVVERRDAGEAVPGMDRRDAGHSDPRGRNSGMDGVTCPKCPTI